VRLRIASVCRSLPQPDNVSDGVFVFNRLNAMAADADVAIVQPVPYAPIVKPLPAWARARSRSWRDRQIVHAPMLYVPGVLKALDGAWLARAALPELRRLHREAPLDAIDAHFGYPEGAGCMRVARRIGVPFFVTIRGFEKEYVHRPFVGAEMLGALRAAAGVISVSHSLRELAIEHGVPAEQIEVIHNAIDAQMFYPGDRAAARAALKLAPAAPLVVSVGNLVSGKRHHVLIEAFAKLRARRADAELVIVGGGSFEPAYPDRLNALARELGIATAVRFLGRIPPAEVATWLRAADAFALGTAREGCCNAVLEALGTGVPVVTTPVGDNAYFVAADENGYIVPVDDAAALAAGIERALARSWDRAAIGRRLYEQAGSWSGVGARVLRFMRERLERRGAAAA
jgi:teichuronic acid biosynthesis glycosyltransferase TuaC